LVILPVNVDRLSVVFFHLGPGSSKWLVNDWDLIDSHIEWLGSTPQLSTFDKNAKTKKEPFKHGSGRTLRLVVDEQVVDACGRGTSGQLLDIE
jgi:hypothetical protein